MVDKVVILSIIFFIGVMSGIFVENIVNMHNNIEETNNKLCNITYKKVIKPMFYDPMWDIYGCAPESVPEYPEWYDESMREEIFRDLQEMYLSKEICFYEKYVEC